MAVRGLKAALALVGVLALVGCAGTPEKSSSPGSGKGYYKVGNAYQIKGVWYYPQVDYSYDQTGIASWYGPGFHAKMTANGETYDQDDMTAAHRTLPMPSIVRVTNLDNGRSIVVRINDRGPYAHGRIIDMSRRGAQLLGFQNNGTAKVRVQVLADESRAVAAAAQRGERTSVASVDVPTVTAAPRGQVDVSGAPRRQPVTGSAIVGGVVGAPIAPPMTVAGAEVDGRFMPAPVVSQRPTGGRDDIYIQVGAFGSQDNVARVRGILSGLGQNAQVSSVRSGGLTLHRVRVGPIQDVDRADALLENIIQSGMPDARIVVE